MQAQVDSAAYPLGATIVEEPGESGVVFRVWAPNATSAHVAGSFNSWSATATPMTLESAASGIWSTHVANALEGQEYKFVFNGNHWRVDPRARNTVNSNGNGIIEDDGSDYPWQATEWETPPHNEMIIYELHVGSFSGNGDGVTNYPAKYRDVVDAHLDDIIAAGANMIQIMPIHEFPGERSWGYNPSHFFAPETDYGTPDDLRYMIDTLHQNGIGVILDVVYNHTSNSDNNLWMFDGSDENIYFYSTGEPCLDETTWGPRPDYREDQVAALFADNAAYWIEEFRFDGLRVDFTRAMHGYCFEEGEGWDTMKRIVNSVKAANPRAIVIAEELPNDSAVSTPQAQGGAGYDAQWCDPFGDILRGQLGQSDPDIGSIAFAISDSGFGRPNIEAVKYVESHDEAGNHMRLTSVIDGDDPFSERAIGLNKLAGALTLLSPGIPMLFMGQEFMEDKKFHDGEGDRIWWGFLDTYGGVRDVFGIVGGLRQTRPSLLGDAGVQITHSNDGANVVAFQRYDGNGDVTFVVANFSGDEFTQYRLGIPAPGTWYELINTDASRFLGSGITNGTLIATAGNRDGQSQYVDIHLAPYALAVFSQTPLDDPPFSSSAWILY